MRFENKCRGFMEELWPKFDVVTQAQINCFLVSLIYFYPEKCRPLQKIYFCEYFCVIYILEN